MRWISLLAFAVLLLLAGAVLIAVGVRHASSESRDSFNLARGKEGQSLGFSGLIAWPGLGLVFWAAMAAVLHWGAFPAYEAEHPHGHSSGSVTNTPSSPEKPSAPPSDLEPAAFMTPGGVVCSTYVRREAMACVIPIHNWGKKECTYVFTLERTGEPTIEACPDEDELSSVLDDYPDAHQWAEKDYGKVFDLGVAACAITRQGTICVNSDRHYIRLSTNHSHPKV